MPDVHPCMQDDLDQRQGQEYMFWNNVETKPWGGYPLAWDLRILEKLGRQEWSASGEYQGKTLIEAAPPTERVLHFAPTDEDWMYPNVGEDDCAGGNVDGGAHGLAAARQVVLLPAAHLRALHLSGVPGCLPSQGDLQTRGGRHRPHRSVALQGVRGVRPRLSLQRSPCITPTRTSEKCIGCYPAVEEGVQPQCVVNCIGKIRVMGFINPPWRARDDNPIDYLIHKKQIALCPTIRSWGSSPTSTTSRRFTRTASICGRCSGPLVDGAIERYKELESDPVAQGLLCLMGSTDRIMHRFTVAQDPRLDSMRLVRS